MVTENNIQQVIRALKGQLQCEQILGGRWLPIGKLDKREIDLIKGKAKQLGQLAQEIAKCRQCSLAKTRLNVVPGQGNPNARIVFVGEAPGQTEDQQGKAFVGRAGNLLTDIIAAMGLKRDDVFIGNILKCRPPDNRDPQIGEIDSCIGYLYRQLEIIAPDIIVALGAHAAHTLLNSNTPIGQLRGRIHQYQPGPTADPIKLVATYHPAYLLRNYNRDARQKVWDDMKKVLKELDLPIPNTKKK